MNMTLDIIENYALQLSHNDRVFLTKSLLASLESIESIDQPNNYEREWINEAKKRYKAFSQNLIQGIDEDTAFQEAFERIQWKK